MIRPSELWESWEESSRQQSFEGLAVALGIIRILGGIGALIWLISRTFPIEDEGSLAVHIFECFVYTSVGFFLYRRGSDDPRARLFGCVFILIGCAYVQTPILLAALNHPPQVLLHALTLTAGLRPEVYLPFFFWLAVERFPERTASPKLRRLISFGMFLSFAVGSWFFLLGLCRLLIRFLRLTVPDLVDRITGTYFSFWSYIFPLVVLALPVFLLKFRQFGKLQRDRAALFAAAAFLTFALPMTVIQVATAADLDFKTYQGLLAFNNLLLSIFPLATAYVVVSHRVLDIRSFARSALRYLFARYVGAFLGLVPFAFLAYFFWLNRDSTVRELFSDSQGLVLVMTATLGSILFFYRQVLFDLIDRSFFRESYNARRVLTELSGQLRGTRNLVELSKLVERGADLALHLERVSLLTEDSTAGRFVDPLHQVRPLDPASQLITVVSGSRDPIAIDLEAHNSPFLALPEDEKLWLIENRVEMIAPMHSLDGSLIGLLALGAKRSELPFLREDRELLAGVASSAGLVVELLRLKETVVPVAAAKAPAIAAPAEAAGSDAEGVPAGDEETALECIACDRVYPPGSAECTHCHVELEKTNAPYILRDLYRLDSRLGAGGMAVVYRAKDLKLGRAVAIKTLPRVNSEAAMRLRREARTAASVSHPGLAAIYGLETWRGVPMIITELLGGGTLADQLRDDPLEALAAIDMARTIALALAKIHTVGILHRDVKPSNIGYTADGDVKLLDFGIARIQHDFRQEKPEGDTSTGADGRSRIVNTASMMLPRTRTGQLVGTVTYLSPEAARGEKPDPGVDLWALAVCVYESLTAENLFYGRNFQDVLNQIRDQRVPDVRKKAPACPEPLALFLAQELDLDRSRRAEDGVEMASRLAQVRAQILAA